jgi:hypothetical protein
MQAAQTFTARIPLNAAVVSESNGVSSGLLQASAATTTTVIVTKTRAAVC